MIEIIGLMMTI